MIRKINSPQGLIALSLFLGTFCAFEAVSTNKARQQTKTGSSSSEEQEQREEDEEDIKKNILDLLEEEKEAISKAKKIKESVFEKIYAKLKKNEDKIPADKVKEMNSFLQKKITQIKGFEEHLGQNQDEMRQIQGLSLSRVDPSNPESPRAETSMGAASAEDDLESLSDEASEEWGFQAKPSMGASKSWGPSRAAASAEDDLEGLSDEASEKLGFQAKPYMGAGSFGLRGSLPIASQPRQLFTGASSLRSSGPSMGAASAEDDREIVGDDASEQGTPSDKRRSNRRGRGRGLRTTSATNAAALSGTAQ